jgi:hypothetical protein
LSAWNRRNGTPTIAKGVDSFDAQVYLFYTKSMDRTKTTRAEAEKKRPDAEDEPGLVGAFVATGELDPAVGAAIGADMGVAIGEATGGAMGGATGAGRGTG